MSSPAARALAAILSNFGAAGNERDLERRKAERALEQLRLAASLRNNPEDDFGQPFDATVGGVAGKFQANKKGDVRRLSLPGDAVAPSPTPNTAPGTTQPPTQLTPYVKPTTETESFTPKAFTLDGKAVQGFTDKKGNYYDADRNKVSGKVTPYAAPVTPQIVMGVDPESGEPTAFRVPKAGGAATPVEGMTPKGTGDARAAAQVDVALNQAEQAHERMKRFEDKMKSGAFKIGKVEATLAHRAYGGTPDAQFAEGFLNEHYPEVAQYVRDAKTIGVAERMITPRGGSNYLTQSETALSAAGPNATPDIIEQAQAYRDALVQGLLSHRKQGASSAKKLGTPKAASDDPEFDALMASLKKKP